MVVDDHQHETPLEMARRHVAEGQARVERQAALVEKLDLDGHDTRRAESVLMVLWQTLGVMTENLARYGEHANRANARQSDE